MASNGAPAHLVIGGLGLVGAAVCAELKKRGHPFAATTRRCDGRDDDLIHLDLSDIEKAKTSLPRAEVLYLVAAMPKFNECEGNPLSWQVNVDAPIQLAQRYRHNCVIFISSDSVEWCSTAYARQKAQVEAFINSITGIIIRPSRIVPDRAAEFARVVVDAGEKRLPGVIRWK